MSDWKPGDPLYPRYTKTNGHSAYTPIIAALDDDDLHAAARWSPEKGWHKDG